MSRTCQRRTCQYCAANYFKSDSGLTKHERYHCPIRPDTTSSIHARSIREACPDRPPQRPSVAERDPATRTVAFAAQPFNPPSLHSENLDSDAQIPDPIGRTGASQTSADDSELEDRRPAQPQSTGCAIRGVELGPGSHPAPGTSAPVPIPSAIQPDPLLFDPRIQGNKFHPFNNWEGFRWAFHHILEAQNSDMEESQLRNLIQGITHNPELDLPSAQTIRKLLLFSPFAIPTATSVFEDQQGRPYVFIHRRLNAAIDDLVGRTYLADGIKLSAEVEIRSMPEGGFERYYDDLNLGDAWADAQIRIGKDGVLMLPIILSSDKSRVCQVSLFFCCSSVLTSFMCARSKIAGLCGPFTCPPQFTPLTIVVNQRCMRTFSSATYCNQTRSMAMLASQRKLRPSTRMFCKSS